MNNPNREQIQVAAYVDMVLDMVKKYYGYFGYIFVRFFLYRMIKKQYGFDIKAYKKQY